jgi:elongation factor Ts
LLRVKLGNKASKAASRITAEGVVAIHVSTDGKTGSIVELNSETDFVAKNDDFMALANGVAALVATQDPADVPALSALPMGEGTVESTRTALIGKIGENMTIRRFERFVAHGHLASYIHGGSKVGVIIDVEGGDGSLARDLAMHIAASRPRAIDASGVDAAFIEKERSIAQQKAAESGKPEDIVNKMVDGAVQKVLKEVTLLNQVFVKAEDGKQTVEQLLRGRGARVHAFSLFVVGEGIEKKVTDFAAEVAAQAAAAKAAH